MYDYKYSFTQAGVNRNSPCDINSGDLSTPHEMGPHTGIRR